MEFLQWTSVRDLVLRCFVVQVGVGVSAGLGLGYFAGCGSAGIELGCSAGLGSA